MLKMLNVSYLLQAESKPGMVSESRSHPVQYFDTQPFLQWEISVL